MTAMVKRSLREGFFLKNTSIIRIIQMGQAYCRMMELAAVVSLLAMMNSVVTPNMHTAPKATVLLNFRR